MELYNNDCFEILPEIKDASIDLVLVDLPYAQTACKWDCLIDLNKMWKELKRCCKRNCIYVFFCTTKFGYKLIQSNEKWFRYDLVWEKSRKVGFLSANKMPLRQHEMMYIFKEEQGTYNPQKTEGKPYKNRQGKQTETYGIEDKERVITDNKGDRHPTSILHIPEAPENQEERKHEMMYIFKEQQGTYNPQKTEGKRYVDKRNYADKTGYYRKDGKLYTHKPQDNKGLNHPTSILNIPEAPENQEERKHQMLYVFSDDVNEEYNDLDNSRNLGLRAYFKNVMEYIGKTKKELIKKIGQGIDHSLRINSTQFALPTEKTYNKLIEVYELDKMEGFRIRWKDSEHLKT
jgi:hypothetical protein